MSLLRKSWRQAVLPRERLAVIYHTSPTRAGYLLLGKSIEALGWLGPSAQRPRRLGSARS